MMIDLWGRLHGIFDTEQEGHPEIELSGLMPRTTVTLIDYFLLHSKNFESAFTMREPFQQVYIYSPAVVSKFLSSGAVVGELWFSLVVEQLTLPEMAFFIDGPDYIGMEYRMGVGWDPVTLTGLFEFFRMVKSIQPSATISLNPEFFGRRWRQDFDLTLRDYLNETL
jgi:hypothetical protein